MKQHSILFPDEADAVALWSDKGVKVWAVDIGRARTAPGLSPHLLRQRPYSRSGDRVCEQNLTRRAPGARYRARLAGPREFGCHFVTAETTPVERHTMAAGSGRVA